MYACEICGEHDCGPDEHCEVCLELLCFCRCEDNELMQEFRGRW